MPTTALRWLIPMGFAAVTLAICTPARAQDLAEAKKLFKEGETAEQDGDCATAISKWRGVLAIKETPQVHLRIGRCQETLGRLSGAVDAYETAVRLAEGNPQVLEVANQQLVALEPRVPTLTLAWDAGIAGASVMLDGKAVDPGGKAIRVDPGAHTVEATAPDRSPFKKTLTLAESARQKLTITLASLGGPVVEPPPEEAGPSLTPWPFVVMGGGVVLGAIAVPLVIVGMSELDDVHTKYGCVDGANGVVCPPETESAATPEASAVQVKYSVATVLGIAGIAAVGVGATLLILDLTSEPDGAAPAQAFVVAPWGGPEGGGLVVGGTLD